MAGERDLEKLLAGMSPRLIGGNYVFCSVANAKYGDYSDTNPLASFTEKEGLTLVLKEDVAQIAGLPYDAVFRCITLELHSSLKAVGLTAELSRRLAQQGIPANMVAASYHDHIFVPSESAQEAISLLASSDTNDPGREPHNE